MSKPMQDIYLQTPEGVLHICDNPAGRKGALIDGLFYPGMHDPNQTLVAMIRWMQQDEPITQAFYALFDQMEAKYGENFPGISQEEEDALIAANNAVAASKAAKPYQEMLCDLEGPVEVAPNGRFAVGNDGTVYEMIKESYWMPQRPQ